MKKKQILRYSITIAATWAWGVSLVVGMQLIQTKGLVPFVIWATANSLALSLFGFIAYRIPKLYEVVNSKLVTIFTTIVCIFCMWIQLNAIYQFSSRINSIGDLGSKIFAVIAVLPLVVILYNKGIERKVSINNPLWIFVYSSMLALLLYCLFANVPHLNIVSVNNSKDISWAINSVFILFSGPIMSIFNWQLAEKLQKEKRMHSHYYASLLFAIYMVLVGLLGSYNLTGISNIVLVLIVLCIALTTADAAIVGMHKLVGKKVGTVIALLSIISWKYVIPMGVMGLWTTMGDARKWVALGCIIVAVVINKYITVQNNPQLKYS